MKHSIHQIYAPKVIIGLITLLSPLLIFLTHVLFFVYWYRYMHHAHCKKWECWKQIYKVFNIITIHFFLHANTLWVALKQVSLFKLPSSHIFILSPFWKYEMKKYLFTSYLSYQKIFIYTAKSHNNKSQLNAKSVLK